MSEGTRRWGDDVTWEPVRPRLRPARLLIAWITAAVALMIAALILPGVEVAGFWGALFVAALVGILNAIVMPILAAVRLPFTVALGFVLVLVVDALLVLGASELSDNAIEVDSFWRALLVSLVTSAAAVALQTIFGTDDDDEYALRVTKRIARRSGEPDPHRRPGHHLPGDRRARPAGAQARDARRQLPQHGALGRAGHARARGVGDRPVVADRGEPGRHPARLERGHPGVPLGREGDRPPHDLLGAGGLRGARAAPLDRHRPADRRRGEPRQPALRRRRAHHPHGQPHLRREAREPGLPRVLRQRLQRHARARAVRLGGRARVRRGRRARSAATCSRAATAAASTPTCAARCASSSAT